LKTRRKETWSPFFLFDSGRKEGGGFLLAHWTGDEKRQRKGRQVELCLGITVPVLSKRGRGALERSIPEGGENVSS